MVVGKKTAAKKTTKKTSATQNVAIERTRAIEKHYVPSYPTKLYIYKLTASKYWWVRYFVNGNAVRKTTKTEGKREALAFAKQFYDTVMYNQRHGIAATASATSFESCVKEVLKDEKAKVARGALSKVTHDNAKYRFDKHIIPHFRNVEVREIDYYALQIFLQQMSEQQLSANTISMYMGLVRKVLQHAARRKFIVAVPEFPKLAVPDVARGWFNTREYRRLWSAASRYVGKKIEVRKYLDDKGVKQTQYVDANSKIKRLGNLIRHVEVTEDMRRLIVFMCNSYVPDGHPNSPTYGHPKFPHPGHAVRVA